MRLRATLPYLFVVLTACSGGQQQADIDRQAALEHYQAGNILLAESKALSAWKERPSDNDIRALLATVYRKKGKIAVGESDYQAAYEAYRTAAVYEPYRAKRAQDYVTALELGEEAGVDSLELADVAAGAAEANPADPDARRAAARHLDNANRPKDALPHYLWIWEADPGDVRSATRLASIYSSLEEHDDAVVVYKRILSAHPKNVQAAIGLASSLEALGKHRQALGTYEDLAAAHQNNPGILFRFADFLERRGETARAEKLREDARDSMPGVDRRKMRKLR